MSKALDFLLPRDRQPQEFTGPSEQWADRLSCLYSLTPSTWRVNQATGRIGGTAVGAGPTWLGGRLRVSGSTSDYVLLEHGLPLNIAAPFTMVIGCERLAGSGVSWTLLRDTSVWYGWYMEAQGDVKSADNNVFNGLVSLGAGNNYAFSHRSSTDLTGASIGSLAIDATATLPTTVNRAEVALGVIRRSTITAGADSAFTHLAVIRGTVTDAELTSLAIDPWQLFAPQTIWVPVSAGAPASYTLTAAAASYSLTGNAAVMRASRRLSAAAGSFALTGNAAGLYRGLRLTAAAGAYAWTANSAGLLQGRSLLAAAAAYTLTGNAATLRAARKLSAAAASYTFTGNAAALTYTPLGAYSLSADAGAYVLTGNSAGLRAGRRLAASTGIYNLTGSAASLLRGYRLAATAQSYGWTVNDATLTYTPLAAFSLTAESAAFLWTGNAATLTKTNAYALTAQAGAYVWTGRTATLTYSGEVITNSAWWTYTVAADDLTFSIPADNLTYAVGADQLAYEIGV